MFNSGEWMGRYYVWFDDDWNLFKNMGIFLKSYMLEFGWYVIKIYVEDF